MMGGEMPVCRVVRQKLYRLDLQSLMNQIALPVASSPSRVRWTLWVVLPGIAILALAGVWAVMGARQTGPVAAQSMLYTVAPMDFPIKINKDGELQATNNIEIMSQV